jgi:hypothetical protein
MTDNATDSLARIEAKLDKIDTKLDNHLSRISKLEAWVSGHSTILTFIGTATIAIIGIIFKLGVK